MSVTLSTLAKECDVDISTVSRALRGDERVKLATRERIKETAKRLGYRPNLAARFLQSGKTKTVLFVIPSLMNPLENELAEYVSRNLNKNGYDLLVALYHNDSESHKRILDRLNQGVADAALVVANGDMNIKELEQLVNKGFPILFIDRHIDNLPVPVVTNANHDSASELMNRCAKEGAEEFFILYTDNNPAGRSRMNGAIEQLGRLGKRFHLIDDKHAASQDVDVSHKNVAVFCNSQRGIFSFLEHNREKLSQCTLYFAAYDNWEGNSSPAEKAFICIQNFEKMAELAVRQILSLITGKKKFAQKGGITTVQPLEYRELTSQF